MVTYTNAVVTVRIDGNVIVEADTEYIADSCFINDNGSWKYVLDVTDTKKIELEITPRVEKPTILDRVKLFLWNWVYRFVDIWKKQEG